MISTKGDIVSTIFLCSSRSQPAGCDGVCTVHYRTYDRTYEFSARNGPNREAQFFATAFLDENRSNRKNNQTNTNRMMGWIENRPNKFLNKNFVRQGPPAKYKTRRFRIVLSMIGHYVLSLYQAYELRVRPQICDLLADTKRTSCDLKFATCSRAGKKNILRPGPAKSRSRRLAASELAE